MIAPGATLLLPSSVRHRPTRPPDSVATRTNRTDATQERHGHCRRERERRARCRLMAMFDRPGMSSGARATIVAGNPSLYYQRDCSTGNRQCACFDRPQPGEIEPRGSQRQADGAGPRRRMATLDSRRADTLAHAISSNMPTAANRPACTRPEQVIQNWRDHDLCADVAFPLVLASSSIRSISPLPSQALPLGAAGPPRTARLSASASILQREDVAVKGPETHRLHKLRAARKIEALRHDADDRAGKHRRASRPRRRCRGPAELLDRRAVVDRYDGGRIGRRSVSRTNG